MKRNLPMFWVRAYSRALRVPMRLTFTSLEGSSLASWILGVRAAAWTMASTCPVTSVDQAAGSATSSTTYSSRSLGVSDRGTNSPGGRMSAATTCSPPRANARTSARPKNPAAPVINTLISTCCSPSPAPARRLIQLLSVCPQARVSMPVNSGGLSILVVTGWTHRGDPGISLTACGAGERRPAKPATT